MYSLCFLLGWLQHQCVVEYCIRNVTGSRNQSDEELLQRVREEHRYDKGEIGQ